ncbi:MAG: PDZ domain-containing protein [Bacteroidota bacterium]
MRLFLVGAVLSLGLLTAAQGQDRYQYLVDLNAVADDQLQVTLNTPKVRESTVEFHMPKIVPGTYAISDFGRWVSDLAALDASGNALPVKKLDKNRWEIGNATQLATLTYTLDDTFDGKLKRPFQPSGTNFEEGQNFLLNTHGTFGYLDGYQDLPFEVRITRPETFFGATALQRMGSGGTTDVFEASRYFELADNPIMYCEPDTASVMVGGAQVMVSVYSPNNRLTASYVKDEVTAVLKAHEQYLGGQLPVDRYVFIIYMTSKFVISFGALEHSYSSVYFLPEWLGEGASQTLRDISSHEFYHIVTPLNIHSEEIGNFDFIDPNMSQHLWLYEGVTEYASHHSQLMADLTDMDLFLNEMTGKIRTSKQKYTDDLPFTEMSAQVLDKKKEYGNVYQKGALIGFCLDIRLREWSNGRYGLQDLIADLSKEYGKDVSFQDDALFDKITELTGPEIRSFLETYVNGPSPLPLKECFDAIGVNYEENYEMRATVLGARLRTNDEGERYVRRLTGKKAFAKALGLEKRDVLLAVNGQAMTEENSDELLGLIRDTDEGEWVEVKVRRDGEELTLKAQAVHSTIKLNYYLGEFQTLTPEQEQIREAWLTAPEG